MNYNVLGEMSKLEYEKNTVPLLTYLILCSKHGLFMMSFFKNINNYLKPIGKSQETSWAKCILGPKRF